MTCSKKTRPATGLSQHLGQGELGLQDGDVVAVAGGSVGRAERVRQDGQPLAQQGVDLVGSESVADGLQRHRILDRGEPVVERLERDAGLGGLAFRSSSALSKARGGSTRAALCSMSESSGRPMLRRYSARDPASMVSKIAS